MNEITLEDLGYNIDFENSRKAKDLSSFAVGRVIAEHKERYVVKTSENEFDAEIVGNLRFTAQSRSDFPAVGDWVAISEYDENKVLIYAVLPRKTIIERQAVGKYGEKQIIATNIDCAFIVQAVDRDFNINRIERYLSICNASKIKPIIILSKTDLINRQELIELKGKIQKRVKDVPVVGISNESQQGYKELKELIIKGKTYCLLGSSGVGKSTLTNNLLGKEQMKTNKISESTNKGRHVTSHRELVIIENGGIIIDNPGMREVGVVDSERGIEVTFEFINDIAVNCKYKDCTHTNEKGCAVIDAVENGEIDKASYDNYLKMEREKDHFESTVSEKRKKDKEFGKMFKNYKKDIQKLSDKHKDTFKK